MAQITSRRRELVCWAATLVALLTLVPVAAFQVQAPAPLTGRVTHVVDGDTIDVASTTGTMRVRLEGVDCPERRQPFGTAATIFTRRLVLDHRVAVSVSTVDRSGRVVARVTADGKDVSAELLKAGLAWHFTDYSSDVALAALEREARSAKRGLWADPAPVPPWVVRRRPAPRAPPVATTTAAGPFHGNTRSRLYHRDSCRNARCERCTATFTTEGEAQAAGYRPARDCL